MISILRLFSTLLLILYFNILIANGQNTELFIPIDVFKKEHSIPEPCFSKNKSHEHIDIFWYEQEIDGSFYLVIHPSQIFLRTAFNNPNPKKLYWLRSIDKSQYIDIVKHLTQDKPKHLKKFDENPGESYISFEFLSPIKEFPGENLLHHFIKVYTNINLLIWELNNNLNKETRKIEPPDPYFIFRLQQVHIYDSNN